MVVLLVTLMAAAAQTGTADGGVEPTDAGVAVAQAGAPDGGQDAESLRRELEQALGKDAAAAAQQGTPATQAPPAATGGASPAAQLLRGAQSLNPDISAILDTEGGYQRRPLLFLNGDDPLLRGDEGKKSVGFAVQEVELALSAIVGPAPGETLAPPVATFGGGGGTDLTYAGEVKAFFPFGDAWSVYAGLSGSTGVSPGLFQPTDTGVTTFGVNRRSYLVGADLYVKWKPPNVAGGYTSFAWQSEAIWRHLDDATDLPGGWDGGFYSQVVVQIARRWFLGIRGDVLGIPTSSSLGRMLRGSASITFQPSEFARVRWYVEADHVDSWVSIPGLTIPTVQPADAVATFLQLEISIGAHGAHPF